MTRPAASDAASLTIAALPCSVRRSNPWSASQATWCTSARLVAMSTAQSASMPWISWYPAIGEPNCTRVLAHSTASCSARSAAPTVRAPIIRRSSTNQSRVSS
jgi:hypothetical protein